MNPEVQGLLTEAETRAGTEPMEMSVRRLLSYWNAKRRGYWIVEQITQDLESYGLVTDPPFTDVWIDADVKLVSSPSEEGHSRPAFPESQTPEDSTGTDVYLRVGSLRSANSGVVSVNPQDTIQRAQSLMLRYDYSQLAVLSGERDLRGAVSWESIAQARIRSPALSLTDATVPPEFVREEDDLLAQIPRVISSGFVFVQGRDRKIIGIVTTADLSEEFARTANPFFVLGEIERRLRGIIDLVFSPEELEGVKDPSDAAREVSKADHLTFGEYVRLLEQPSNWDRLGWDLDRKTFIEAINDVRSIRNDVMHFSPDPLDEDAVTTLKDFAQWLRKVRS